MRPQERGLAGALARGLARALARVKRHGQLLRQMYDTLEPGDVVLADDYFIACELRQRGIELVARAQYQRVGARMIGLETLSSR